MLCRRGFRTHLCLYKDLYILYLLFTSNIINKNTEILIGDLFLSLKDLVLVQVSEDLQLSACLHAGAVVSCRLSTFCGRQ